MAGLRKAMTAGMGGASSAMTGQQLAELTKVQAAQSQLLEKVKKTTEAIVRAECQKMVGPGGDLRKVVDQAVEEVNARLADLSPRLEKAERESGIRRTAPGQS